MLRNQIRPSGPQIDNPKNLSLPAEAEVLLRHMFASHQRVVIKAELGSGFSSSRVFVVYPIRDAPERPAVVKMALPALIEQEYRAYRKYIRRKLSGAAEIEGEPVFCPDNDWGGLCYPLVGDGIFEVKSLHSFCRGASLEDIRDVLVKRLFERLRLLWRFSHAVPQFNLGASYDRLLPVNLLIEPTLPPPDAPLRQLKPGVSIGHPFRRGDGVCLEGFVITEIDRDDQAITLNLPARADAPPVSYRLRLQPVEATSSYQVGDVVDSIAGVVRATRNDLLQTYAQRAMGQEVAMAETLILTGEANVTLPNPLAAHPTVLSASPDVRVACIHGDLNMENILVNLDTRDVGLIDFAMARRDHVLHDFLRLETGVVTWLLPEILAEARLSPDIIYGLYERLHHAGRLASQQTHPALRKAFGLLAIIRHMARECLFEPDDWGEYYQGLTLYLLGALKFRNLDEGPQAPLPKQVAFWGAAAAQKLLQDPLGAVLPALDEVVARATTRSPDERYQQAGDMARALQRVTAQDGPEIRIPFHRPPRAQHFTGRKQELAQLLADLQPGRVVTLCGPGGIGKTALAAEAVWTLAPDDAPPERFPDGIVFHSFYNQPQAALALEAIARAYDQEPRPTPRDAARRVLAGKRALLILDGTEEADDLGAVLGVRGGCGVLVTSRTRKDAIAERQDVPPLEPDDAVALLRAWGKEQVADETAASHICEQVGRLPLAVRLAGRYLDQTEEPAGEYLAWLEESPIQALHHGERREESVDWLLARSLEQVSAGARETLAVVGLLALAPFGVEAVAQAMGLTVRATKQLLGELVSYGLLLRPGERYQVSHALVHTYARWRMIVPDEVAKQLAAYYVQLTKIESEKGLAGYRRLDVERAHLMRVLAGCVERKDWEAGRNLAWTMSAQDGYLDMRGHWTERVTALEMGVTAAQQLGHRQDEGAFLGNLGIAYRVLGQVEADEDHAGAIECHEDALAIAREIGDRRSEGDRLGSLGNAYRALGQVERAIEYHEAALAVAREIGDRRGEGSWLGNLGIAYRHLGQVERAIEYHEAALAIAREIGDRRGEGYRLGNLGIAYRLLGQVERAVEYHEAALAVAREIGDRRGEGSWLGNLGIAYRHLGQVEADGDHPGAIEFYQQALAIAREIGDRHGEGNWLGNLGVAYRVLGKMEQAIEYHEAALVIAHEIGDRRGEGADLSSLSLAYRALGKMEQAIEYHEAALAIAREIGNRCGGRADLSNLGLAYRDLGQVERLSPHLTGLQENQLIQNPHQTHCLVNKIMAAC